MIRTSLLAIALTAMMAFAGAGGTARAGMQDFHVVNDSGVYVLYIYVSPSYADSWGGDVLGNQSLPPNSEVLITMNGYGDQCWFDIRIEDEYQNAAEYLEVDLCNVSTVYYQ